MKRQILYKVRTLLPGEIFGHEEIIRDEDPKNSSFKREFRVTSIVHSEIIFIKKNDFVECKEIVYLSFVLEFSKNDVL